MKYLQYQLVNFFLKIQNSDFVTIFGEITYINDGISANQAINYNQKHGNHDEICTIPISIPIDFNHPFPKVQIKTDPNANAKRGNTKDQSKRLAHL